MNFIETVFYDELALDDKCPTLGTLGTPVLEEEEGRGTYDLEDLLDRKGKRRKSTPQDSGNVW